MITGILYFKHGEKHEIIHIFIFNILLCITNFNPKYCTKKYLLEVLKYQFNKFALNPEFLCEITLHNVLIISLFSDFCLTNLTKKNACNVLLNGKQAEIYKV